MCLLDGVLAWNEISIRCVSRCYQDEKNPMRRGDGSLGAACGIEIAAQAMALHNRLAAGEDEAPRRGYLASVRDVMLAAARLDEEGGDLMVDAELLMGDSSGATYRFALARLGVVLVSGRATVVLGSPA
jgi:predicted hotdog family 3-hydroxylacyl-ACP dehydratase